MKLSSHLVVKVPRLIVEYAADPEAIKKALRRIGSCILMSGKFEDDVEMVNWVKSQVFGMESSCCEDINSVLEHLKTYDILPTRGRGGFQLDHAIHSCFDI